MKFKLELELTHPENIKTIEILAAMLEEDDAIYEDTPVSPVDVIEAINHVCCSAPVDDEDIDRWLRTQNFSKPESRELFKKHMQVRLSEVFLPLTIHAIHDENEDEEEEMEI